MTSKYLRGAITTLFVVALALACLHYGLVENVLPAVYARTPYWSIYVFLVPLSLLVILVSAWVHKMDRSAVGRTFFIFVFIKLFGSIAFLAPWLFWKDESSTPMVYQFFAAFFPILFVEVKQLVTLLNSPSGESLKNSENQ